MKKVLFICTGNTCRSPMAEAVFNKMCSDCGAEMTSESAGLCTVTGLPAAENSVKALALKGIDISNFQSTSIMDKDTDSFDLFAVMTYDHRDMLRSFGVPEDKIFILAENGGGISDPYGGSEARYHQCLEEITDAVKELLSTIIGEL